jgi:hypothetical protein
MNRVRLLSFALAGWLLAGCGATHKQLEVAFAGLDEETPVWFWATPEGCVATRAELNGDLAKAQSTAVAEGQGKLLAALNERHERTWDQLYGASSYNFNVIGDHLYTLTCLDTEAWFGDEALQQQQKQILAIFSGDGTHLGAPINFEASAALKALKKRAAAEFADLDRLFAPIKAGEDGEGGSQLPPDVEADLDDQIAEYTADEDGEAAAEQRQTFGSEAEFADLERAMEDYFKKNPGALEEGTEADLDDQIAEYTADEDGEAAAEQRQTLSERARELALIYPGEDGEAAAWPGWFEHPTVGCGVGVARMSGPWSSTNQASRVATVMELADDRAREHLARQAGVTILVGGKLRNRRFGEHYVMSNVCWDPSSSMEHLRQMMLDYRTSAENAESVARFEENVKQMTGPTGSDLLLNPPYNCAVAAFRGPLNDEATRASAIAAAKEELAKNFVFDTAAARPIVKIETEAAAILWPSPKQATRKQPNGVMYALACVAGSHKTMRITGVGDQPDLSAFKARRAWMLELKELEATENTSNVQACDARRERLELSDVVARPAKR